MYIIISGLNLLDNNRGTAALSYGAISFLKENGYLKKEHKLLNIKYYNKFWKKRYHHPIQSTIQIEGFRWTHVDLYVSTLEKFLFDKFSIVLPWTNFAKFIKKIDLVANINGGDGFSDIYNTKTFLSRLHDTWIAQKMSIPYIMLPQTIGPFSDSANYVIARNILKGAKKVYVRDDKFKTDLDLMKVPYELTKDLSAYMLPEKWNIDIKPDSIGVNVSGLAYSNRFRTLSGQFDLYPELISKIILYFQSLGKTIYLIPHSYCIENPEINNDDMIACREVYKKIENKQNIVLLEQDLISPKIKYVISKMSFFIGTRMHANFAAIYTKVPLFGLAYSYKFAGAFNANGLDGNLQTAMINNITEKDIDNILNKIKYFYSISK